MGERSFDERGDGLGKRGQLMLFIILTIVVVVGLLAWFNFDFLSKNSYMGDNEAVLAKNNLIGCFEIISRDSLDKIGTLGGYYERPVNGESFESILGFVPYYYYLGEATVPSLELIEGELSKSVRDKVAGCVDLVSEDSLYDLSYSDYDVDVNIGDSEVEFIFDFKLSLSGDEKAFIIDFKDDSVFVASRIKVMHLFATKIIDSILTEELYWFDLTLWTEFGRDNDLTVVVGVSDEDPESYHYVINLREDGVSPFRFEFLTKYNTPNIDLNDF